MKSRKRIHNQIQSRLKRIEKLLQETVELRKEQLTLTDKMYRYEEKEVEVLVSGRPKKYETRLQGIRYWTDFFLDEDTGKKIALERSEIVKENGKWLIADSVTFKLKIND